MYGYIYKITNNIDGKFYVGKRAKAKFQESYWGSGVHIKRALAKYGKENFSREILEWCEDSKSLNEREMYWIDYYNAINSGYNIHIGGKGGDTFSGRTEVEKQVIRKKMSDSHPESYSPEFGKKISNSLVGIKFSKERCKNISNSLKGITPWNKGIKNPYDKETRNKMSESAKRRGFPKEQHAKAIETIKLRKYHWYNNGIESHKYREDQQPDGWFRGRLYEFRNKAQ